MDRKTRTYMIGLTGLFLFATLSFGGTFEGWAIETDGSGVVTKMAINTLTTPLTIENAITIEINPDGSVAKGTVIFKDGLSRLMEQLEAQTYWEMYHGQHILWNFYEAVNKVTTITPSQGLPSDWVGRNVRVVTGNNSELYGTLVYTETNTAKLYAIKADHAGGGLIFFDLGAIHKVQIMNFINNSPYAHS
jgi:hypothetical protein